MAHLTTGNWVATAIHGNRYTIFISMHSTGWPVVVETLFSIGLEVSREYFDLAIQAIPKLSVLKVKEPIRNDSHK
jgi:hypothetical protein